MKLTILNLTFFMCSTHFSGSLVPRRLRLGPFMSKMLCCDVATIVLGVVSVVEGEGPLR